MVQYYSVINLFIAFTLFVMVYFVYENKHYDRLTKYRFYLTYLLIFFAMLAEWAGILLNQAPDWTTGLHKAVKCLDYILTPAAGVTVAFHVSEKKKIQRFLEILIIGNTVFQIISAFTGWTYYIDADNIYHHGPLYAVYVVIYMLSVLGLMAAYYQYSLRFSKNSRNTLIAVIVFLVMGIAIQEILGYRTGYLTMTISAIFLFIYFSEFSQITSDASLQLQKQLLETDALTGLFSRYAYTNDLKELEEKQVLPRQLIIFAIDINELKVVNDQLGHLAGDEIIKGAADCIKTVLQDYGKCYRTGGDEFTAIIYADKEKAYELTQQIEKAAGNWRGSLTDHLSVSIGYADAAEVSNGSIEKIISAADMKMYEAKAQYYMQDGKKRRDTESKRMSAVETIQKEYIDIISALANEVVGLYMIDRKRREVTVYRLSENDHRIRSGVPLKQEFEKAMERFIEKIVHPDDRELMLRSIRLTHIEEELDSRNVFTVHFRGIVNGDLQFFIMRCIRNVNEKDYDKIIISFEPEESSVYRMKSFKKRADSGFGANRVYAVIKDRQEFLRIRECLLPEYELIGPDKNEGITEAFSRHVNEIAAVLYDQRIEELSIPDFLLQVKQDARLLSVPVIVINDREDADTEQLILEAGASEIVTRPFSNAILKSRVTQEIRMKEITRSLDAMEVDDLTGIYTREAFLYHAKTLIDASADTSYSIIISDIQNFKIFNSIYGEKRGDELLRFLAGYIRKEVQKGVYARYGADQFIAIMRAEQCENIKNNVNKLQTMLDREFPEHVVIKFGIYENVDKSLEIARMCDRALLALKSIKHNYDLVYARFDGPVSQQHYRAQMYESRFQDAIINREFVVWYQPKYDTYTEKVVGAEALVRWKNEDGRMIQPGEFLRVFEADGLIGQLDEYVFRTVCEHQKRWKEKGNELIPISVNLSRNSMHQPDIVQRYRRIAEECGVSPKMVPIEITESAAVSAIEIRPLADAFCEAGFPLHLDDFGSGNSSLTSLNVLPFDVVKLDKSLIDYIGDEHGNLLLMYIIAMGKEMGFHLLAEGVENIKQLRYLKDTGCEVVQGYYFSRPLPEEEFEQIIADNIETVTKRYDFHYKLTAADSVVKRAMDRLLQRMPGGFLTYRRGEDERIISSNRYLWNLFGCGSEDEFMEYVGGSFKGIVCPEELEIAEKQIEEQINSNTQEMDYLEYSIIRKDGKRIRVVDYGYLDHQSDGDIFYVFISEIDK